MKKLTAISLATLFSLTTVALPTGVRTIHRSLGTSGS